MNNIQLEMWPEEITKAIIKGYRLHQRLLDHGEKPDTRPWAGIFDRHSIEPVAVQCPQCSAGVAE
jgi:hypothetical protein